MSIRIATEADIPRIVELGMRFNKESSYKALLKGTAEKMEETTRKVLAVDGLLVSERGGRVVGMIGFILYPHFFTGEMVAGEVVWYVEPEFRGEGVKLMREAEARCQARGAQNMYMIAPNEKVGKFYEAMGYAWTEASYQKSLVEA